MECGLDFFLKSWWCVGWRWGQRCQHRRQLPLNAHHLQILVAEELGTKDPELSTLQKEFLKDTVFTGIVQ